MRLASPLLAVVVASAGALAPSRSNAQVLSGVVSVPWTVSVRTAGTRAVTAPAALPDAMPFQITASAVEATRVTRIGFMIMGSLQRGDISNYEVVYYPNGYSSPGVVVGSDTGAGWARGATSSIVSIALATPVAVQGDFTGAFALRVDVNGTRSFYFQPRLQTVGLEYGGVERPLLDTEMPINGDVFHVN